MSLNDLLKGKEKIYKADPLADDINSAGKSGLGYMRSGASSLSKLYQENPSQLINTQIGLENRLMRGAGSTQLRDTGHAISRAGLSNTASGLNAEINQQRSLSDGLAMNQASGLRRLRDARINNAQGLMGLGQNLFNTKIQGQQNLQMQDIKTKTGGWQTWLGPAIQMYGAYMANKKPDEPKADPQPNPNSAMNYQTGKSQFSNWA